MEDPTRRILEELAAGRTPNAIPVDCDYAVELDRLAVSLATLQRFAMALCQGDLSHDLNGLVGPIAGSLKMLQANLRHLTWQAKQIADGDFTQRVDFLGDFSTAFNSMVERLDASHTKLLYISTHDALTGLYNRAYFDTEVERLGRGRNFPFSLIISDVNGLKQVNDQQGHAVGDTLLKKAALLLRAAMRGDDIIARIGGDEFAVLLPRIDIDLARTITARIRKTVEEQDTTDPRVSFALGVGAALEPGGMKQALKDADDRMYQDKQEFKVGR